MPTILILASSPLNQGRLRLGNEVKQIRQSLGRSKNRENWKVESNEAATVDDLRRALLDFQPAIVHFCGHGGGDEGLIFENDEGGTHATRTLPLTRLLHQFKDDLQCVVLNACYSEVQANEICQQINYVVGMSNTVDDEAATKFSVAFYDSIFAGTSYRQAFDIACASIDLSDLPDHDVPVFCSSPELGGNRLHYSDLIPQIEDFLLAYIRTPFSERFPFTTRGKEIEQSMIQYYGEATQTLGSTISKVSLDSICKIDDEFYKVIAIPFVRGQGKLTEYVLRIRGKDIKLEWEASVGYWSVPPRTFLALGSRKPIVARVKARLGKSYFGQFSDLRDQFQTIDIKTVNFNRFYGYVKRDSECSKILREILMDGNSHQITLSIRNGRNETDEVLILDVLSRNWIYDSTVGE